MNKIKALTGCILPLPEYADCVKTYSRYAACVAPVKDFGRFAAVDALSTLGSAVVAEHLAVGPAAAVLACHGQNLRFA